MEIGLNEFEQQSRFMKMKVRVKGILLKMEENTNILILPIPFIAFLGNLIKEG